MELIRNGKTKDVYKLDNGNYLLKFKDTVTGHAPGVSDPGGNKVVGSIAGVGSGALKMTVHYFELLKKNNVVTHYVGSDLAKNEMTVRPAKPIGNGLEFVVRYRAAGSFLKRFGFYCREGQDLPGVFEVTLKDDEHDDPPATKEILEGLGVLTGDQYDKIKSDTLKICAMIRDDLKSKGLVLYDIKVEFGIVDGAYTLIDEISAGNMRVFKDGKKLDYLTLSGLI